MKRLQAVALGILVGLVAGCSPSDPTYLPALLDDPMAHIEWEGLELDQRFEDKEGETFWGYSTANVMQSFDVLDPAREDELVLELKEYAESAGWVFEEEPGPNGVWRAQKQIEQGRIGLALYINSATPDRSLVVTLDYEEID